MSLKMKLVSMISAFVLVIGMLLIGVFAVNQAQVDMGGSITFNADDVYARVTGSVTNAQVAPEGLDVTYSAYETEGNPTAWESLDLEFDSQATPIVISITVENLSTERSLTVNLTDALTSSVPNLGKALQRDNGAYASGTNIPLDPKDNGTSTTTFTITLSVTNKNQSLTNAQFDYDLNLFDECVEIVEGDIQITNVQINDTTPDTNTEFNGGKSINDSIDLSNITFETGETEIIISMTSLNENYIKNIVSYDTLDNTTSSKLLVHSTSLYLPQNTSGQLTSGESKDLKIYVNNNMDAPTTIPGLKVTFEEKTSLLQNDTANQYYYVEMGTIMGTTQSEYIKWRYISADGENAYTYNSTTAPSGTGYFILETNVLNAVGLDGTNNMIEMPFNNDYKNSSPYTHVKNGWDNINANDYATSSVRQYINGNNAYDYYTYENNIYSPSGRYSNMYSDYNIDPENDLVYQNIIGRSLGDLYSNMYGSSSGGSVTFPTFNEGATIKYTESDTDKFWLLSYKEALALLGSEDDDRVWPSGSANTYWLRSPYSSNSNYAYIVHTSGWLTSVYVKYSSYAARAAFKFSI